MRVSHLPTIHVYYEQACEGPTALEADAAEAEISNVLDRNRTLESAAFSGGKTALHHAAGRNDALLVRLLLERGCKPHQKVSLCLTTMLRSMTSFNRRYNEGSLSLVLTLHMENTHFIIDRLKTSVRNIHMHVVYDQTRHPSQSETQTKPNPLICFQDFSGKRACDLTRDLECLRLLGSLKKAPTPYAISRRTLMLTPPRRGTDDAGATPGHQHGGDRLLVRVHFRVAFWQKQNKLKMDTTSQTGGILNDGGRTSVGRTGGWVEGVTRWVDLRQKVLHVVQGDVSGKEEAETDRTPPPLLPILEGQTETEAVGVVSCPTEGVQSHHQRSVFDVRLLSCHSPTASLLFEQLKDYADAWKLSVASEVVEYAVNAAAELSQFARFIVDELIDDLVGEVAPDARGDAENSETTKVGGVPAPVAEAAMGMVLHVDSTTLNDQGSSSPTQVTGGDDDVHQPRRPQNVVSGTAISTDEQNLTVPPGIDAQAAASLLNFECTAIASWLTNSRETGNVTCIRSAPPGGQDRDPPLDPRRCRQFKREKTVQRVLVRLK